MDQFTRRIIGFGVHPAPAMDGKALSRLFHQASSRHRILDSLSSDYDPVFRFYPWQANLRIIDIREVKTIPFVPVSHPFIDRLIGTIRREYLDHLLIWNESDLERKLEAFQEDYNGHWIHQSLSQQTPDEAAGKDPPRPANPNHLVCQAYCRGLCNTPMAA